MNGCRYCIIMHFRRRRGKRLARGIAMCLAREQLTRCEKKRHERGSGCEYHDAKARAFGLYPAEHNGSSRRPRRRSRRRSRTQA